MDIDKDAFLATMGNVAASVTVVTTFDPDDRPSGLTVSAFSSVSLDPPMVLVCIGDQSTSLESIRSRGGFTVNFMAAGTGELAMGMASKVDDKFEGVAFDPPTAEVAGPVLSDAVYGYFECATESEIVAGDHVIFLARVLDGRFIGDADPLVYWRRNFANVAH